MDGANGPIDSARSLLNHLTSRNNAPPSLLRYATPAEKNNGEEQQQQRWKKKLRDGANTHVYGCRARPSPAPLPWIIYEHWAVPIDSIFFALYFKGHKGAR